MQITYAVTLQQTDNQIEALDLYKKILEKNPCKLSTSLFVLWTSYKNFGEIENSIISYKKSYEINNFCGDAY